MIWTTEQEYVDFTFPDDDTKTINDVIQLMVDNGIGSSDVCINILKTANPSVDWSI